MITLPKKNVSELSHDKVCVCVFVLFVCVVLYVCFLCGVFFCVLVLRFFVFEKVIQLTV